MPLAFLQPRNLLFGHEMKFHKIRLLSKIQLRCHLLNVNIFLNSKTNNDRSRS